MIFKLVVILGYYLRAVSAQPCSAPIKVVDSPIQGSCVVDSSSTYEYSGAALGSFDLLDAFSVR